MNEIHPFLIHLPVSLALTIPGMALFLAWLIEKQSLLPKAWHIVSILQFVHLILIYLATATGASAARLSKEKPVALRIGEHEDIAWIYFFFALGLVVMSIYVKSKRSRRLFFLLSLLQLGLCVATGYFGGRINHL